MRFLRHLAAPALALTLPARALAAEPPPRTASLAWVRNPGAESCIGPRALTEAVERKLGRQAVTAPSRADLTIEGRVDRTPSGFRAVLALVGEAGEALGSRELSSKDQDCRTMDDELALVIAVLIDPGAILPTPAPQTPAPPPPPPVTSAPAPPCPTVPEPRDPWRVGLDVGVLGGLGILPSATFGVSVRAHITPPRWPSFELAGAFWTPRNASLNVASFTLGWGSIGVCPFHPERNGNELRICGGFIFGALHAESINLAPPSIQEQLVFDVDAELRYVRRIVGPLQVSLGIGVLVPLIRDRFYYFDAVGARHDVFQPTAVAGTGNLTVGVQLP